MARRNRPTQLRLVEGRRDRRPRELQRGEPVPLGELTEPPDHLSEDQKAGWDYVTANAPTGLLKRLDRGMLVAWVVAESLHREATIALQNSPKLIKTPGGAVMQSPWVGLLNRQAVIMKAMAVELGFSPAARTRVECGADDQVEDPTDRYFPPFSGRGGN